MINIGLIGTGRIGKVHGENIAKRFTSVKIKSIVDPNEANLNEVGKLLGIDSLSTDPSTIFNDKDIQAVLICSSTDTHSQYIEMAAKAKKHIFCEKPIDFDTARIDNALKAVKDNGVKLQIGFNRRFDPNFAEVRKQVAAGSIGDPHLVRITSRDPYPPSIDYVKVSGGLFLDMMIHDFDMARFLINDEVESVYASGSVKVDEAIGKAGDIDTAIVTLNFKSGAICAIDNSRKAAYGYDQRVEVFGSEGMIRAENNKPTQTEYSYAHGVKTPKPFNFFMDRYTDSYFNEINAFVESLVDDKPITVTGEDGKIPVLIALAAKKSLNEKRVVFMDEMK
jgi:myo-inositol 2-dehydrogenase/D-chiro-inositol 1-dehydrogenase